MWEVVNHMFFNALLIQGVSQVNVLIYTFLMYILNSILLPFPYFLHYNIHPSGKKDNVTVMQLYSTLCWISYYCTVCYKAFNPDFTPCRSHCRVGDCYPAFYYSGLSGCLHFVFKTRYYQVGADSVTTLIRLSCQNILSQTQAGNLFASFPQKKDIHWRFPTL